jgi:hypothetical protein
MVMAIVDGEGEVVQIQETSCKLKFKSILLH